MINYANTMKPSKPKVLAAIPIIVFTLMFNPLVKFLDRKAKSSPGNRTIGAQTDTIRAAEPDIELYWVSEKRLSERDLEHLMNKKPL